MHIDIKYIVYDDPKYFKKFQSMLRRLNIASSEIIMRYSSCLMDVPMQSSGLDYMHTQIYTHANLVHIINNVLYSLTWRIFAMILSIYLFLFSFLHKRTIILAIISIIIMLYMYSAAWLYDTSTEEIQIVFIFARFTKD